VIEVSPIELRSSCLDYFIVATCYSFVDLRQCAVRLEQAGTLSLAILALEDKTHWREGVHRVFIVDVWVEGVARCSLS